MRLYVVCRECGDKIYLDIVANSRKELLEKVGKYSFEVRCYHCGTLNYYTVNEVIAEPSVGTTLAGAGLGALVGGVLGGPIGLLLGGALGGAAGANTEEQEKENARRFNEEVI